MKRFRRNIALQIARRKARCKWRNKASKTIPSASVAKSKWNSCSTRGGKWKAVERDTDGRKTPWRARGIASLCDGANKMSLCILPGKPSHRLSTIATHPSLHPPPFLSFFFTNVFVFVVTILGRIRVLFDTIPSRGNCTTNLCNQSFWLGDRVNGMYVHHACKRFNDGFIVDFIYRRACR